MSRRECDAFWGFGRFEVLRARDRLQMAHSQNVRLTCTSISARPWRALSRPRHLRQRINLHGEVSAHWLHTRQVKLPAETRRGQSCIRVFVLDRFRVSPLCLAFHKNPMKSAVVNSGVSPAQASLLPGLKLDAELKHRPIEDPNRVGSGLISQAK